MNNLEYSAPKGFKKIISEIVADRLPCCALIILLSLYLIILFADFIAPYSANYSDKTLSYQPPSKIFIIDENNHLSFPYTYNYKRSFDSETMQMHYNLDKSQKYYIKLFSKGESYKILGQVSLNRHLFGVENGGNLFILGTDINGRDTFSRLLFGGRISLTIGFLALFIAFPIGMLYGGVSGYFGGAIDALMMRIAEAIMSIPSFYLLIIMASVLPTGMTSIQRFLLITVILALIGWAGIARVIRGMVMSIKTNDYVTAAKAIGVSKRGIILKYILPQTLSFVIIAISMNVPSYILSESGLSFLGLGIQQPDASWGNMLKDSQEYVNILTRPWLLAPGFLIFVSVLSFNIIGDKIRDILDPKSS